MAQVCLVEIADHLGKGMLFGAIVAKPAEKEMSEADNLICFFGHRMYFEFL